MSLTVAVVRYSGCGAEREQAAATRSELPIRSNQWKVRILMPFLQKARSIHYRSPARAIAKRSVGAMIASVFFIV